MNFDEINRRRLINAFARRLLKRKIVDDFPWQSYTSDDYKNQYLEIATNFNLLVEEDESLDTHEKLEQSNIMFGVKELYRNLVSIEANSILEIGAGSGVNLINLSRLLPEVEIFGIELLASQVALGRETFGENFPETKIIVDNFLEMNVTPDQQFDVVFTNAVIMHLSKKSALKMLELMISKARKFVLLHENLDLSHEFDQLLEILQKKYEISYEIVRIANTQGGIIIIKKNLTL